MTAQPHTIEELQTAIKAHPAIAIRGGRTKSTPVADSRVATLDMTALGGVTEYSPEECVLTALGGTRVSQINSCLSEFGQYLPFDPLLVDTGATIGGTIATGLSGSGRHRYGGVRDFVIGMRVVDGEGRVIRSGGKVVKNAAGFLLHHGMVGSLGRFGAIAEVTLKVFPAPELRATVRVESDNGERTARRLQAFDLEAIDFDRSNTVWARIAGRAESLDERVDRVQRVVGGRKIDAGDADRIWAEARELRWVPSAGSLIKTSGTTGDLPEITSRFTCAGSESWIAVADVQVADQVLKIAGGRGLVVRGAQAGTLIGRRTSGVFDERVRSVLDPRNRFSAASNPER
jgi:glycolate oxidase FAD binding subunit